MTFYVWYYCISDSKSCYYYTSCLFSDENYYCNYFDISYYYYYFLNCMNKTNFFPNVRSFEEV